PAGHRPLHPSERGRADRDRPPGRPEPWPPTADGYPTDLPPSPTEPYWSQQLPREWGPDDDEDGRTQIRPPTRD
ncbi:MAG TPA: hypothetical protein PLP61_14360, partial [Nocardioides sp.]|uniref:hypothetical protein n=1 Tax=Nocardioides sp. TaxID=35761 RepID=UPI002B667A5B